MIVIFEKDYLRELYENVLGKQVTKGFKRGIDYLKWASRKEELFTINSLHFESLHGDKQGLFSIRANLDYRIEFTIKETIEEQILTICNIVELSNHYD